jgi:hypothetical protein
MFWKKKPQAVITISRQTGFEEACSVVVNTYSADRNSLYKAISEAGEALRNRLIDNNKLALATGENEQALDPACPTVDKTKKKYNN